MELIRTIAEIKVRVSATKVDVMIWSERLAGGLGGVETIKMQ